MYARGRTLTSFPVSAAALAYISGGVLRSCASSELLSRIRIRDLTSTRGYLSRRTSRGIYHIATFTTSLRVVLRDYFGSSKTNLHRHAGEWHVCNSGCAALPFVPPSERYLGGTDENNICMRPPTLAPSACTRSDYNRPFASFRFALFET